MVRVFAALAEDWGLVVSTHTRKLITGYNSSAKGFNTLFWSPKALAHTAHVHTWSYTHTYKETKILITPQDGLKHSTSQR